jgi:CheY-like chemotaxis protein
MQAQRVLIVEDDSLVAKVLSRTFERAGFEVTVAGNGERAWPLLKESRFDVMICDINMPRMSGRELCTRLKAEGTPLPRCTLIVTSRSEHEQRSWVREISGLSLLEKPVGPKQLLQAVHERLLDAACSAGSDAEEAA